jgi:hypothetical protein
VFVRLGLGAARVARSRPQTRTDAPTSGWVDRPDILDGIAEFVDQPLNDLLEVEPL